MEDMENRKKRGSSDEQLIEALEERLHWYLEEAPAEEVDGDRVDEIVRHLHMLKRVQAVETRSDEEALAQFHAYVRLREEEGPTEGAVGNEEADKTAAGRVDTASAAAVTADGVKAAGTASGKKKSRSIVFKTRTRKFAAAAAAVLLVALVAGGSMGAANANQGNGFFYWLQRDDEGVTMITSPENMDGEKEIEQEMVYDSLEEIPEEYHTYLIDKAEISELHDYKLKQVIIHKADTCYLVQQWFVDEAEEKNVYIGALVYGDNKRLAKEAHLSEEYQVMEGDKEIEQGILLRDNTHGEKEGEIFFYVGNVKYLVDGDIEMEMLMQIAEAYRDMVLKQ